MFKVGQRVWVKSDKCFGVVKSIDVYGIYYNISFENSPLGKTTTINDLHETADDMFEKLGFEYEDGDHANYYINIEKALTIQLRTYINEFVKYNSCDKKRRGIDTDELQAIYQYYVELGKIE